MSSKSFTESLLKDIEENENGSFRLEQENGIAMLSVSPPAKKGKAVDSGEILTRLHLFGISDFKKNVIDDIVKNCDGKFHEIGLWKGGNPENAIINVEIDADKMSASIYLIPPKHGGKSADKQTILDVLNKEGIIFGINEQIIADIVKNQIYLKKITIAEGQKAIPGNQGTIECHFSTNRTPTPAEDSSGKVDFKNISVIQNVKKEDLIAEMQPPTPGTDGKTVTGVIISAPVATFGEWKLGAHCYLSADKSKLYSQITGRPILEKNGTIKVDEVCYLENVDFSTGNIDFPGTIVVEGTVADDFHLSTEGSIIIKKSVGRVFLKAGGDIILSGGVMGKNGGFIESKKDIYVKFIEQGRLNALGSIYIEEASMHSVLMAGDSIQMMNGRGEIIGGETIAGISVICKKLGAVVETHTSLTVGTPPDLILELEKIREELTKNSDILNKIKQSLNKISDDAARKDLSEEEKIMLQKLNTLHEKYDGMVNSLQRQQDKAMYTYEPAKDSFVHAEKVIFPGVEINLGSGKIFKSTLKEIQGKSYIYLGNNGLVTHSSTPPIKAEKSL